MDSSEAIQVIAASHPLLTAHSELEIPAGLTLDQILAVAQPDSVLRRHAFIFIDDRLIERERWTQINPRPGERVLIRVVPSGGGGKNPLRVILTIAVLVTATVFGGPLGGLIGLSGKLATAVGTAAISLGGTLLINAIAPLPLPTVRQQDREDSPLFSIAGARNRARPFSSVPVILGRHRQVPPLGSQTYTEILGKDQYLRMLVVWGYGPLNVSDIKIGETPIAEFEDVEIETREGRPGEADLTLYTNSVMQENFSVLLSSADGFTLKRTEPDAESISMDFVLPRGLAHFNEDGSRGILSVTIRIEYRLVGTQPWIQSPGRTWSSGGTPAAIRNGHVITRAEIIAAGGPGQYEVRVRRTTPDRALERDIDEIYWAALRSFEASPAIRFDKPLARTALRIRATDQLHATVDQLNAICAAPILDWDGAAWVERETSNNAAIYRHILQGPARSSPIPDSRIDLAALEAWHDFCRVNDYEYNSVRDYSGSLHDALREVAAAGRASPSPYADGKWSVIVDTGVQTSVQHFTPRNSAAFRAERTFTDIPDAIRVRFLNRNEGWRDDERVIYRDGFDETNAETFAAIEARGITDPDHIYKFGRFHLAQLLLRREMWSFDVDFEYLVAARGGRVKLTHDVLLVGQKSARIKALVTNAAGDITSIEIDEEVRFESGVDYGVSIRSPGNPALTARVQ